MSFDKNITVKNQIKTKSFYISLLSGRQGVWSCWILDHFELLKRELRQWKSKKCIYFFTHVTNLDTRKVINCYSSVWFDDFYVPVCIFNFVSKYTWKIEPLKAWRPFHYLGSRICPDYFFNFDQLCIEKCIYKKISASS